MTNIIQINSNPVNVVSKISEIRHFEDPLTKLATSHFERVAKLKTEKGFKARCVKIATHIAPSPRLVKNSEGTWVTAPGLNRIFKIFCRVLSFLFGYMPKSYQPYLAQNRAAVAAFREFLYQECGVSKVDQIEGDYKLDLEKKAGS